LKRTAGENKKAYSGSQQGGLEDEVTKLSSISTRHAVFYLPEDPNVSGIGNPTPILKKRN
jgi:hypothetical protein